MRQLKKKEIKKLTKEYKRDQEIYVLAENIQYARNVANMFRICDAAGVKRLYLTGISHKPPFGKDLRKASRSKEQSVEWKYEETSGKVINTLKKQGFEIIAVELTDEAFELSQLARKIVGVKKVCFVVGSEVYGVTKATLERCHSSVFIPMYGKGASLNVSTSLGVVLFSF